MIQSLAKFVFLIVVMFVGVSSLTAQSADGSSPIYPVDRDRERERQPKGYRDMMEKMRIEEEKKDYEEMLKRGDEALKISEQLEKSLETSAQLSSKDLEKLESLEKLVKKIRGELGGSDDDGALVEGDLAVEQQAVRRPGTIVEGFRILKSTTVKLVDELKKTTRFSISTAAIQSSNAVLRLARFLRIRN